MKRPPNAQNILGQRFSVTAAKRLGRWMIPIKEFCQEANKERYSYQTLLTFIKSGELPGYKIRIRNRQYWLVSGTWYRPRKPAFGGHKFVKVRTYTPQKIEKIRDNLAGLLKKRQKYWIILQKARRRVAGSPEHPPTAGQKTRWSHEIDVMHYKCKALRPLIEDSIYQLKEIKRLEARALAKQRAITRQYIPLEEQDEHYVDLEGREEDETEEDESDSGKDKITLTF